MKKTSLLAIAIGLTSLQASPWGKDSDLVDRQRPTGEIVDSSSCSCGFLTRAGIAAIRFHQRVISPADGPRSHFIPSSSQYTLEAMKKYGFFSGYLMGCDRLMRENDDEWVYRHTQDGAGKTMKWDPVP